MSELVNEFNEYRTRMNEVILSKDNMAWGNFFYDPARDQMRAKIQVRNTTNHVEALTYDFINLTKNTAELVLNWEKKQFPVSIEFAVDDIVMRVREEAEQVVKDLFDAYFADPAAMPESWRTVGADASEEAKARHIADYLAGMTDTYAIKEYRRLFDREPDLG